MRLYTLSTSAMKAGGAKVTLTASFRDAFGNPTTAPMEALFLNQTLAGMTTTATFRKTGTIGTYTTVATILQPGIYNVRVNVKSPSGAVLANLDPNGTDRFNINPGLGLRATFVNFPTALPLGDTLTRAAWNLHVLVTDTLNAPTNAWDGEGRATGSLGGVTKDIGFIARDADYNLHSGVFDFDPKTVFLQQGRYTMNLFHREPIDGPTGPYILEIPFLRYAGNRVFDIVPKPVMTAMSPSVTLATTSPFALTVEGTGFTVNSRIVIENNTQASTQLLSPTMLRVDYVAQTAGTLRIKVLSNMTRGVHSDPMNVTVVEPIKTAFVTVSNIPTQTVVGTVIPTVQVVVKDSAGTLFDLTNPTAYWYRKGVSDLPLVLIRTGLGQYNVVSTRTNTTEAAQYLLSLRAENAEIQFAQPRSPMLNVVGGDLVRVKVENYLPAPAPLYRDILPGHYQGDTIPAFTVRGYDQYDNLTEIPFGVALYRTASPTAPAMIKNLPTRPIWRGVIEVLPFKMDSAGEFELQFSSAPFANTGGVNKNFSITLGGPVPLPTPFDEDGNPIKKLIVIPIIRDFVPGTSVYAPTPILLCANPFILPQRVQSGNKVDTQTSIIDSNARKRFATEGYDLVWSDEFTTFDATKWTRYNTGTVSRPREDNLPYNGLTSPSAKLPLGHIYREGNVSIQAGHLRLTNRKLNSFVTDIADTAKYKFSVNRTSAGVHSRYKADFRYGKIVVKTKVPNVPLMHHGVWLDVSEHGAPKIEIDFPDAPNAPSTYNESDPNFGYRYLNNRHPRFAMNVPGNYDIGGNIAFGDFSCAAPLDSSAALGLEEHMKEREYWVEWDRDSLGGYVRTGVTPIGADGKPDESKKYTVKWWGLQNSYSGDAQFVPDAILQADKMLPLSQRKFKNETLGRHITARQTEEPFKRLTQTWLYDYFSAYLCLDMDATNSWGSGECFEADTTKMLSPNCQQYVRRNDSLLSLPNGQFSDIDYVRVYQRTKGSARNFRPLILNGEQFTAKAEVFLYNDQGVFRRLETRPLNSTGLVAMVTPADEEFVGTTKKGYVTVVNFSSDGRLWSESNRKLIIFGTDSNTVVRANQFIHRYEGTRWDTLSFGSPAQQILRIRGDGPAPFHPFAWAGYTDRLNLDISNLPALGSTSTLTVFPSAYSSLSRLQTTVGKWDIRLRTQDTNSSSSGGAWSNILQVPSNAGATPNGTTWETERPSQDRNTNTGENFRAVRLPDSLTAPSALGFYPSCSDVIEVTASIATPATGRTDVGNIFADVNRCGTFTIRTYLDPRPQVRITGTTVKKDSAGTALTATITARLDMPPLAMTGAIDSAVYTWEREILRLDTITGQYTVQAWAPITDGTLRTAPTQSGTIIQRGLQGLDSVRIRCRIRVPASNTFWQCPTALSSAQGIRMPAQSGTFFFSGKNPNSNASTLSSLSHSTSRLGSDDAAHSISTVNVLTAPNPAQSQFTIRFDIPDDANVTLELLNPVQTVVALPLNNKALPGGHYEIPMDASAFANGTYIARLSVVLPNGTLLREHRTLIILR